MKKIIFLFSGQGSQYFGMCKSLYKTQNTFKNKMDKMDEMVYELTHTSPLHYMYDEEKSISSSCDDLMMTHTSIFMMEYAIGQMLMKEGICPDLLIGYSLGEYVALALSGAADYLEVLKLLIKQVEIITANCNESRMLAIIENSCIYYENEEIMRNSEICSVNFKKHFVVGGSKEGIFKVQAFLQKKNVPNVVLPVTYGFHTSFIDQAKEYFTKVSNGIFNNPMEYNIYSSAYQKILDYIPENYLWNVIRQPVYFDSVIRRQEISDKPCIYVDLGIGGTLSNFITNIIDETATARCMYIVNPMGKDDKRYEKVLRQLKEICHVT